MNHTQEQEHHITGTGTYLAVFAGLIFLTILTTAVSFINLHAFNVVVALGIATCKMLLVSLWFMHVKHSTALTKIVLVAALLWLAIMLAFTLLDFHSRGWIGTLGR